jgi:hypothetical protein
MRAIHSGICSTLLRGMPRLVRAAGEQDQAEAVSARAALQIYKDLHVTPFAELIRTALASLATGP